MNCAFVQGPPRTLTHGLRASAVPRLGRRRQYIVRATLEVQKDFVQEMKKISMELHKAPPPGSDSKPLHKMEFTPEGFLRHLVEARLIYRTFEKIIYSTDKYSLLRDSGLDRSHSLETDLAWLSSVYQLEIPEPQQDGPGQTYSRFLNEVSVESESKFLCHYYNYYLAHTAGGRFIGKKIADATLDGALDKLAYYNYDSDLKALVADLKQKMNTIASSWTESERGDCLEETPTAFKYAGAVLRALFQ